MPTKGTHTIFIDLVIETILCLNPYCYYDMFFNKIKSLFIEMGQPARTTFFVSRKCHLFFSSESHNPLGIVIKKKTTTIVIITRTSEVAWFIAFGSFFSLLFCSLLYTHVHAKHYPLFSYKIVTSMFKN